MFRGREDKLFEAARLFDSYLKGDVLDVGCDAKHLSEKIQGRYVGIDVGGAADIRVNLEAGLPFHDKSFDAVVAFDVLEHCERIHFVFDELCRVSRCHIIIGLPNMYEWHFRLVFLLGKGLGGKYGLPPEVPADRHRWLFKLNDARRFVRERGAKQGFSVSEEALGFYKYQRFVPKFITLLGRLLKPHAASLFAYHYWAVMTCEDNALRS